MQYEVKNFIKETIREIKGESLVLMFARKKDGMTVGELMISILLWIITFSVSFLLVENIFLYLADIFIGSTFGNISFAIGVFSSILFTASLLIFITFWLIVLATIIVKKLIAMYKEIDEKVNRSFEEIFSPLPHKKINK